MLLVNTIVVHAHKALPSSANEVALHIGEVDISSIKEIPGQEAAILSYVDPLVAVIIGIVVLKEPLSWQQFAGGALILGFTLWNELDT